MAGTSSGSLGGSGRPAANYYVTFDLQQVKTELTLGSWHITMLDHDLTLVGLQRLSNVDPNVGRYAENETGYVEVLHSEILSYSGVLVEGRQATVVTISDDYLGGSINTDCTTYRLLPDPGAWVNGNSLAVGVWEEPTGECEQGTGGIYTSVPGSDSADIDVVIKVAMDADETYSTKWGGSVFERQVELMAEAEATVFKDTGITFNIIEQWRWTSGGPTMGDCNDQQSGVNPWNADHWQSAHSESDKEMLVMLTDEAIEQHSDGTTTYGCVARVGGLRSPDDLSFLVLHDNSASSLDVVAAKLSPELGHLPSGIHDEAYTNALDCKHPGQTVYGGSIMRWFYHSACIEPEFSKGIIDPSKNNLERLHTCAAGPRDASTCPEN